MELTIEVASTGTEYNGTAIVQCNGIDPAAADADLLALAQGVVDSGAVLLFGQDFAPPNTLTIHRLTLTSLPREIPTV